MAKDGADHEVLVDVDALANSLQKKVSGNLVMSPHCSIFKIPTILSRHNINAFTPNAFSIGPFHHADEKLKPTEKIKSKYLLDLISRLSNQNPTNINNNNNNNPEISSMILLKNLTKAINEVRQVSQEHYAGPIGMEANEFVELLVLDGCFIIELFRRKAYPSLREMKDSDRDPIFSMPCLLQFLHHDLILLENQIPWLVLDILFDKTKITSIDTKPLIQLALEFFGNIFSTTPLAINESLLSKLHGSKHILDLLRNLLVSTSSKIKKHTISEEIRPIRPAKSLKNSGIIFRRSRFPASILEIKFIKRGGIIEIPNLLIQETTETMFRNLISLEQCCANYDGVITSYAVFLDNLISTKEDMGILCKNKAILSWLNMEDAFSPSTNSTLTLLLRRLIISSLLRM